MKFPELKINKTSFMDKIEKIEAFKARTKQLALRVIRLYQALPRTGEAKVLGNQLLRSATSVAANYRAACRGRSQAETFSKLRIVVEEADETLLWLELMQEVAIITPQKLQPLVEEYTEVVRIANATRHALKQP